PEVRDGIPHHLLDIWEVTERASVADYQRRGRAVLDALLGAGRLPVVVGGSGLYLRALLEELTLPGTDPALRALLEADLANLGPGALHDRLAARDPAAAAAILPSNGRRLVRALEVVELTGSFQARLPAPRAVYESTVLLGLDPPLVDLDARIVARVDDMFARGLVAEVRALERRGLRSGVTASRALGYRQVLESEANAPARTLVATRRFARRQRSWFRRDNRIHWLNDESALHDALRAVAT
ncbi:MAG: tRNA (adenosine(37)-N6)-dimethylallyltransferase, partial [Mycobacteriales bacterium]